jgi:hypothetical protein
LLDHCIPKEVIDFVGVLIRIEFLSAQMLMSMIQVFQIAWLSWVSSPIHCISQGARLPVRFVMFVSAPIENPFTKVRSFQGKWDARRELIPSATPPPPEARMLVEWRGRVVGGMIGIP